MPSDPRIGSFVTFFSSTSTGKISTFSMSSVADKGVPAKAIETAKANFFLSNEEGIEHPDHAMTKYNTPGNKIINMQN